MKKTIVSLALIVALLTACGNIEIHFADPEDVRAAVAASSGAPAAQDTTTHQELIAASQGAVKSKPIANGESDADAGQFDEAVLTPEEEQKLSAAPETNIEAESLAVPESQPDSAPTPATPPAYGAIPFELAASTGTWWGIDATDSAYWAVQENINAMRAAGGLPGLAMDDDLSAIADTRCGPFVAGGPFDHSGMVTKSEILAAGPLRSASEVCAAWQSSEVHYANIMRTDITRMGVGCWFCEVEGNQYTFWTVTFE